eukprot:1142139-Pelagomonas_calceolata.AAC.1
MWCVCDLKWELFPVHTCVPAGTSRGTPEEVQIAGLWPSGGGSTGSVGGGEMVPHCGGRALQPCVSYQCGLARSPPLNKCRDQLGMRYNDNYMDGDIFIVQRSLDKAEAEKLKRPNVCDYFNYIRNRCAGRKACALHIYAPLRPGVFPKDMTCAEKTCARLAYGQDRQAMPERTDNAERECTSSAHMYSGMCSVSR